ncbi:MAG: GNAT family N-acetyltransferase, partial [Bacillota bacterium]|nr:GNAT family N-acetyltransferase [Bacillota bacterium]
MIRNLFENDHEQVMAYLSDEPSVNLFIIGDIEAFGYQSEFQELWAEFDDRQQIKGVLLQFYQSFVFYAKGEFDIAGFAFIMKKAKV